MRHIRFAALTLALVCAVPAMGAANPFCEAAFEAAYTRLISRAQQTGLINATEMRLAAAQNLPASPFSGQIVSSANVSFVSAFDKLIADPGVVARWSFIQERILKLADGIEAETAVRERAFHETENIFKPRELVTLPNILTGIFSRIHFLRAGGQDELFIYNTRNETFKYPLKTAQIEKAPGFWHSTAASLVTRDGRLWLAGFDIAMTLKVKRVGNERWRLHSPGDVDQTPVIHQFADGRVVLASTTGKSLRVLDVSGRDEKRALLDFKLKDATAMGDPVFYTAPDGTTYLAFHEANVGIHVFRSTTSGFRFMQDIPLKGPQTGTFALSHDGNGNLLIGGIMGGGRTGYRVLRLRNGKAEKIFEEDLASFMEDTAEFHWTQDGRLLLVVGEMLPKSAVHIFEPLDKTARRLSIDLPGRMGARPAWFTTPNGMEVFAVNSTAANTIIFSSGGSALARLPVKGIFGVLPEWTVTVDGRTLLAVAAADNQIKIFDMWNTGQARGEEP